MSAIGVQKIEQKNLEKTILDRILTTKEVFILSDMILAKITANDFEDALNRNVFSFIYEHYKNYWTIPSIELVESTFSGYFVAEVKDNVNILIDEFVRRKIKKQSDILLKKMINENLSKGELSISYINELNNIINLKRARKKEDYFISSSEKYLQEYKKKVAAWEDFTWIKIWLPYIDNDFGWIQPDDFIGLLADEKKWKSWIMLWIAYRMLLQWKNVIFFSPEMSNEEVLKRLHLIHTNLNSKDFYQWKLSEEDFKLWENKINFLKELQQKYGCEFISIDDIEPEDFNLTTIKERLKNVETKLKTVYMKRYPNKKEYYEKKKHVVDAMIIDWFHMLNGNDVAGSHTSEWREFQKVSQRIRAFARIEKIPVLVSLHTNRDKQKAVDKLIPDQSDTSMTASLWRDLTLLISLFSNPTMQEKNKLGMAAKIVRRSKSKIWQVTFDPDRGLIQPNKEVKSEKEFMDDLDKQEMEA